MLITSTLVYSVSCWLLIMLVPQVLVRVFSNDVELMGITVWAMRIFLAGTIIFGAQTGCQQSFLALGQAKISLILALLRKVILLIPLIYILPLFFADKLMAVFLAEPVADVLAAITTFITFHLWCRRNLKPDNGIQ